MSRWPHLLQGLAFECRRLRRDGSSLLVAKIMARALSVALWPLLLPATLVLHIMGYRRVNVFTDRIGHLCLELDCLLKDQALGNLRPKRWFVLARRGRVANEPLLEYWATHIRIYRNRAACFLLESMSRYVLMKQDISGYVLSFNTMPDAYRVYASWGQRAPLLRLSGIDEQWARTELRALGLPPDAWFACVHCREGGYSAADEELHSHRNSDISAASLAMEAIVEEGGWVVRIGDPTMKPVAPHPRIIDYAHHPIKSPRLDIVLCAKSKFVLGNTSGIALVATIFGIPCATANTIPTWSMWFGPSDLSIPKLLWSNRLGRYLSFEESFADPVGRYHYSVMYRDAGIRPDENSPEDLRDLAVEMMARLANRFDSSAEDDARWQRLRDALARQRPGPLPPARMGALFLRRHEALLHTPPPDAGKQAMPR